MRAHLPPAKRARVQRRVARKDEPAEEAVGERRLARLVRELRADQLRDYLRALPRCEQRAARLIVIRELGPRRAGPVLAQSLDARRVPERLRERLREIVGDAVDHARLHTGEEAAAVAHGSRALAIGDHVFFADAPEDALIAHEVAHVAQSRCGKLSHAAAKAVDGGPADAAELEADLAAQAVVKEEAKPALPPAATATGLAESEGQRATQLAAQAERLKAAPPKKESATTPPAQPTPVAEKTPPPPPQPQKLPPGTPAKSALVELFAKKPSQQAAEWTQVKEQVADKQPLPKMPVKLDGKEAQAKAPADASGKDGTIDVPAATPPAPLAPAPQKEGPPLPKPPEVKVASDDKAAVESAGKKAIDAIPTKDPQPPPKVGPAPVVELAGESDPVRAASAEGDGVAESHKQAAAAKEKIVKGPGAGAVQPKTLDEQLPVPPLEAEAPLPPMQRVDGMDELRGYRLDAAALQAFDDLAKPKLEARLAAAKSQVEQASQKRDKERADAISDAQKKTADANRDAAKKQSEEVQKARKSIVDEQKSTIQKQQKSVADLKQQSGAKRTELTGKIDARAKADQQQIADSYRQADKKAQEEHRRAEEEAKKKKQQAQEQSKDKSWWQRAKEAVASAIKSLADSVCDLLAKARDAVCKLIDAAKQLACRMIDAARDFIKSAIGAFGDWLKNQVSSLLGSVFPGLAARLNSFIDRAVNAAKRAVDVVADGLKKGVTALCEGLKKAVKAATSVFQSLVRGAAALATAVVTGDWRAVAKMVIEAALKVVGVDPAGFWAFLAKAEASLKKIAGNPRGFVGNLISAVKGGFDLFAKNLWTHLQNGFVSWLFNTVSSAGITVPAKLDLSGIFDVVCQALGLTRDKLEQKAKKLIGDKNVERIKKVMGYVEPLVKSGLGGLWEKIQQDLAGLQEAVIGPIKTYLVEQVVKTAIFKIATMFNPAGAIAQLLHMSWNVYCWLRDNMQRIMGLVQSVVDSIAEIVDGKLDKAAKLVDQSLGKLVPIAIDLLAKMLGLGSIGEKVKEILGNLHKRIDEAIDKLLQRFVKQAGDAKGDDKDDDKEQENGDGKETKKELTMAGEHHTLTIHPGKGGDGPVDFTMASENPGPIRSKIATAIRLANQQERHGNTAGYREEGKKLVVSVNQVRDLVFALDRGIKPLTLDIRKRAAELAKLKGGARKKAIKDVRKRMEERTKKVEELVAPIAKALVEMGAKHKMKSLEMTGEAAEARFVMDVVPVAAFEFDQGNLWPEARAEFQRQIGLQMRGMNAMTVEKWRENREKYGKKKAQEAAAGKKKASGRSKEGTNAQAAMQRRLGGQAGLGGRDKGGSGSGDFSADDTQAALHNPDQIAGGAPDPGGMGSSAVNSEIGRQWPGPRVNGIQSKVDKFKEEKERKETRMNVTMSMTVTGTPTKTKPTGGTP